jgi:hypothetical protein
MAIYLYDSAGSWKRFFFLFRISRKSKPDWRLWQSRESFLFLNISVEPCGQRVLAIIYISSHLCSPTGNRWQLDNPKKNCYAGFFLAEEEVCGQGIKPIKIKIYEIV